MNKKQFIEVIAKELKSSKVEAKKSVDVVLESITKALKKINDPLRLLGFGTFKVKKRGARQVRNPQTGKPIKVPAKNYISFAAGAVLKKAINGKKG